MFPVENIRKLCDERGTTIAQMERELGIGNGVIGKWKNSRRSPEYDTLLKIAEYLDVSLDQLAGKEKSPPPTEDDELYEYLEMLRQRPGMRALLKVHKGSTDEEIAANVRFIEELRGIKDD